MKYTYIALALLLPLGGCHSTADKARVIQARLASSTTPAVTLRIDQIEFLVKYEKYRGWILKSLDQPRTVTIEELQPHAAGFLGIRRDSSLDDIASELVRQGYLNEARRKKLLSQFGWPADSTWPQILRNLEDLRTKIY